MAILGKWSGGAISLYPTTSYAAPNALFPTEDRNDSSTYTFTSSTSTLTLPSSIVADGYLFLARVEIESSHNNRLTANAKIVQASGTGTFVGTAAGGYGRDNSEDRTYIHCWGFVDNPSGSSTYQFQWKRDSGTGSPAGATVRSAFEVIPLYYSDFGAYTSTSASLYGGTTPNVVTGFSGTDGSNITISSDVISVTGDNKRYLVFASQYFEGHGGRTQRWHGLDIDGVQEDAAKAYTYYRNSTNDMSGEMFSWLLETSTATVTIESTCYRGDGVSNGDGGADDDGSTPSVGSHSIVVLELNDTAEVFVSRDTTVSSDLSSSPTDLEINTTTDFNDTASFTDEGNDQSINVVQTSDCIFGANISGASNDVSTGSRWTAYAELHINGTEDTDIFGGDYLRNNQGSADTFGWGASFMGFQSLSAGDDVGVSVTELSGTEDGGNCISPAGWSGFWGINLDTLEAAGAGELLPSLFQNTNTFYAPTVAIPAAFRMKSGSATEGNTTSRLTGLTGTHGGKLGETVNPLPTVDLASDGSREDVWSIEGTAEAKLVEYEFRVLYEGVVADTVSVTPKVTLGTSSQNLTPSLFTDTNIFYASTVSVGGVTLTPGLFTDTNIFPAATISSTYALTPSLFQDTNTFYAPTVSVGAVDLTPSLFQDTNTFFGPTVSVGAVTLTPSLFANGNTFYSATISASYSITPSLFQDTNTFFSSTVSPGAVDLQPTLFQDNNIFLSPTVAAGAVELTPGLVQDTNVFFSATITQEQNILPSLFQDTNTFYAAAITTGTVGLTPGLFQDTNTFFSPTISVGGVTLTPSLFTDTNTFYAAVVAVGGVTLTPSLFQDTNTFFSSTVSPGAVNLAPSLFQDTNIFLSPTVSQDGAGQILTPGLFQDTNIFFGSTITVGEVTIIPSLFTNQNIFYTHAVTAPTVDLPSANILPRTGGGALPPWPLREKKKKKKKKVCLPEEICPLPEDKITPAMPGPGVVVPDVEREQKHEEIRENVVSIQARIDEAAQAKTGFIPTAIEIFPPAVQQSLSAQELQDEEDIINIIRFL